MATTSSAKTKANRLFTISHTAKLTEQELVQLLQHRSEEALAEIIHRYSPKVFSLALRLTKVPSDAEEVLQDVFSTLFRKSHLFEGKSSFSSWIYRITVNAAFMKLRRKRRDAGTIFLEDAETRYEEENLAEPSDSGDIYTLRRQVGSAVESAIAKLPDEYRAVFIMRDIDGLTSEEVGEVLGLSIPAVKSRLHRSRLMIKRRLLRFYREYAEAMQIGE